MLHPGFEALSIWLRIRDRKHRINLASKVNRSTLKSAQTLADEHQLWVRLVNNALIVILAVTLAQARNTLAGGALGDRWKAF
jgi:hypothetical protein